MAEGLDDGAEPQVSWPEIMAPLADAVRLVDDEQRGLRLPEPLQRLLVVELLRRDEQKLEVAFFQILKRLLPIGLSYGRVHLGRFARLLFLDALDLVLLQSNKRGDDNRWSGDHETRDLINRRLPRAGRHHGQRVATIENRLDGLFLAGAKALVFKPLPGNAVDVVLPHSTAPFDRTTANESISVYPPRATGNSMHPML